MRHLQRFICIFVWAGLLLLPALRSLGQCSVYPAGIFNLSVISVTDTSVTFNWSKVTPQNTYYNYVVTTDSAYTGYPGDSGFVYFYHFQPDTVATQDSLQPGTKYYIFVDETRCSATDSVSFITSGSKANPCRPGLVPTPSISSSTGRFTVCGNNGTLLLTSGSPTGNTWYLNGQTLDSIGSTLLVTQSGFYTLVVVNAAGCKDTSVTQPVTLDPGPPVPVLTTSGSTTICRGSSVGLFSSSSTGNQWYAENSPLPGETGSEYLADSAGVYWVQVTDGFGCWANSADLTVKINPNSNGGTVTPIITPGGSLYSCADTTVLLLSSQAINYQWFWNGDAIPGENGDTMAVNLTGSYTVATGTAGCGTIGMLSAPVTVTFVDQVQPQISILNGVLMSNYPTGNQWYLNNTVIWGAIHQEFTPRVPGSYTVRVGVGVQTIDTTTFQIGVGGCYSQYSVPWVIADSDLNAPQVWVYPNPMVDVLTLVNKRPGPVTVRIFNLMGQQVFQQQGMIGTVQVDVSRWSNGAYFVQVIDQGTQLQEKVVVMRL